MELNFRDTELAFRHLSDRQLQSRSRVFALLAQPISSYLAKLANFGMGLGLPISPLVKYSVFQELCGGETLKECEPTIHKLAKDGVGTCLDYSAETLQDSKSRRHTLNEIKKCIDYAAKSQHVRFVVSKLSGCVDLEQLSQKSLAETLNLDQKLKKSVEDFKSLVQLAAQKNVRVFIDAEQSWLQDAIDELAESLMQEFNKDKIIVYTTVQLYRHDRLNYMKSLIARAKSGGFKLGLKLVRGAYMESERARAVERGYQDPIQKDKESTDRDFDRAIELIFENLDVVSVCIGSHNEASVKYACELCEKFKISKSDSRIEFSQLYGMSDHLTYVLAQNGFNVSKYLPYGPVKKVMPYLVRRAEENSSIRGQTSRELKFLLQEKQRRKSKPQSKAACCGGH